MASVGIEPSLMGYAPVLAVKKVLKKARLNIKNIDLFEINEAFAAQSLPVIRDLKIDKYLDDKINLNGGAIALGHPIGASGSRIVVTLINEMITRDVKKGSSGL